MVVDRFGSQIKLLRMATPKDASLENRKPDKQDRDRCKIGYLMVGRFIREDGTESDDRLYDLAMLRADGGVHEINAAARAAGNTKV